jgi:hypothetical protein
MSENQEEFNASNPPSAELPAAPVAEATAEDAGPTPEQVENVRAAAEFMAEYTRMDEDYGRVVRDLGLAQAEVGRLTKLLEANGIDPTAAP